MITNTDQTHIGNGRNGGRVIILGAGASAGFDNGECRVKPPVTRSLIDKAIELKIDFSEFDALNTFLRTYYDFALAKAKGLDIEEALTMIDLANDQNARRDMLRLIKVVLTETLRGAAPCKHHKLLFDKLRPNDTIISFNWDLILDNIATNSNHCPDYGACSTVLVIHSVWLHSAYRPKFLKLHGSLNWMYCRACNTTHAYLGQGKVGAEEGGRSCPDCHRDMEPLITPPTLLKSYGYSVIQESWSQARFALKQAAEIVVVGYSLPITDFYAKWLFIETIRHSKDKKIVAYDINSSEKAFQERFAAVFHEEVKFIGGGIKEAAATLSK